MLSRLNRTLISLNAEMNNFCAEINQKIAKSRTGGGLYITTDGALRFCIVAPLLEIPLDFKEWYTSDISEVTNFPTELLSTQAA